MFIGVNIYDRNVRHFLFSLRRVSTVLAHPPPRQAVAVARVPPTVLPPTVVISLPMDLIVGALPRAPTTSLLRQLLLFLVVQLVPLLLISLLLVPHTSPPVQEVLLVLTFRPMPSPGLNFHQEQRPIHQAMPITTSDHLLWVLLAISFHCLSSQGNTWVSTLFFVLPSGEVQKALGNIDCVL